jgi:HD-GYP domain-containing protein (c-di-GMP phosphodiesterase class II)
MPDESAQFALVTLGHEVATGARHNALLDSAVHQLAPPQQGTSIILPKQLTARARQILEQGGRLLEQLRELANLNMESESQRHEDGGKMKDESSSDSSLILQPSCVITDYFRETTTMAETALRLVATFPDAATAQLRLSVGVEAILRVAHDRVGVLRTVLSEQRRLADRAQELAALLSRLHEGKPVPIDPFERLAESLLAEADSGSPLRFLHWLPGEQGSQEEKKVSPVSGEETEEEQGAGEGGHASGNADRGSGIRGHNASRFVACHSLNVAQVLARLVRADPELRLAPTRPLLAGLLHDVGMLGVSTEVLAHRALFDVNQRAAVERHPLTGAEIIRRSFADSGWLAEVAALHHERLDGTGYPSGLTGTQIGSLARLVAVCDVYAAMAAPRPHRPDKGTRAALTETLLLAEQGVLDSTYAERLVDLSFYPPGSVVELADGAIGVVVAVHPYRGDLGTPARPVVSVVMDAQGEDVPLPRHVDLAQQESLSIVRGLSREERLRLLGTRHPELV